MQYTIKVKVRGKIVSITGTVEEICAKASQKLGFSVTPESVLTAGVWHTVYRHDYQRPSKSGDRPATEAESWD